MLFGTLGAALLVSWVELLSFGAWASPAVLGTVVLLALVCAAVESLPLRVDDNLTIPAVGALVVAFLSRPPV